MDRIDVSGRTTHSLGNDHDGAHGKREERVSLSLSVFLWRPTFFRQRGGCNRVCVRFAACTRRCPLRDRSSTVLAALCACMHSDARWIRSHSCEHILVSVSQGATVGPVRTRHRRSLAAHTSCVCVCVRACVLRLRLGLDRLELASTRLVPETLARPHCPLTPCPLPHSCVCVLSLPCVCVRTHAVDAWRRPRRRESALWGVRVRVRVCVTMSNSLLYGPARGRRAQESQRCDVGEEEKRERREQRLWCAPLVSSCLSPSLTLCLCSSSRHCTRCMHDDTSLTPRYLAPPTSSSSSSSLPRPLSSSSSPMRSRREGCVCVCVWGCG